MWPFRHPEAERAFLLQYQGPTVPYGLATALVSLVVALFKAASAAVFRTAYVLDGQLWWRIAAAAYMPLLYLIIGQERYILYFGATGFWIRLVFAAGWITGPRPRSCVYPHCALLWHHRLLVIHAASVLHRIRSRWYWFGGICSWCVAAVVEVADPDYVCPASVSCLITGLQASAETPAALLHAVLQSALRSSRVVAVDIVLPGLLLTWLELRARKAWWQKQLRQQHTSAAAGADTATATAGCAGQQRKDEKALGHCFDEQHQKRKLTSGSCSCSTTHSVAKYATQLPNPHRKDSSRAPAESYCMQNAKQLLSPTGNAELPASAEHDRSGARAEADAEKAPVEQQSKAAASSPAGSYLALADSGAKQHAAVNSAAALQKTASAGMQQSDAPNTTSLPRCTAAQAQGQQAAATPPVGISTATSTVTSSSTQQVLPVHMLAGVALDPAPAALAPHVGPAVPLQPKRVSALYVSPLESVVASFKFNEHPGKGLVAIKRFQHQLAAAVEAAATAAAAGRTPQALAGPGPAVAAWVTSTAAFPGCFQVVMHLALPKGQMYGSTDHVQQLLHGIKCAAQQMADACPDCKGLIDVQVKLLQEQQQQPLAVDFMTHTAPTAEVAAAGAADTTTALPTGWPVCLPATHGSSYSISVLPVAVGPPSLDSAAAALLQVELCIPGSVVEQLSAAGQRSVRVVVASQLPAGGVMVDRTYQLPNLWKKHTPAAQTVVHPAEHVATVSRLTVDNAAAATAPSATLLVDRLHKLLTAQHQQQPTSPAAGKAADDMAVTSNAAAPAAAATTLAEARNDWHLQLEIPCNHSTHSVLQQFQVLTSIVLAGHVGKHDNWGSPGSESAASAAASSSMQSQTSSAAVSDPAAGAASLHGVIAELPLLVLPEGPAVELQKLFEATVADGTSLSEAFEEMLPLLRDMAAALCFASGSSYADSSYGSVSSHKDMPPMMLQSLSVFFAQRGMQSCEQLLDAVSSCQQMGMQMTGDISFHSPGGDDDSSKGGAGKDGSQNNDSAGSPTVDDSTLNSTDGSGNSSSATGNGAVHNSSSSSTEKVNECRQTTAVASNSCISMPTDEPFDENITGFKSADNEVHIGGQSAKACDEKAASTCKASAAELDSTALEHALQSPAALRVSLWSVLFGFPSAAVEAAYLKYRAARLHLLDFVLVATGPAAVILPMAQLLLLLWSGVVAGGGVYDVDRALALTLRTVGVGTHWLAHAMVWGAGSGVRVWQPLHQWRSAVLLASIGFVMSVTIAFNVFGGAWARATRVVLQEFRGTFLGVCLHRDLIYPLFACTEILPYNIIFVVMQFVLFDSLFERPTLPGFGRIGSVVLLVSLHQAVATAVEAHLRKNFVRRVRALYAG